MRKVVSICFRALLIMSPVTVLYSQSALTVQTKSKRMTEVSQKSDQSLLSELNAQFINNFLTQDTSSHNKIIHKNFICIESSGQIVNRETYMKNWVTDYANGGYVTFSYSDEVIRIFGNMALVRSRTNYTKMVNGKTVEGNTIYTDTYIKENGTWLCVQAQITSAKKN